ncbi:MAG: lipopolysaccharide assembly protein LapA domain-containing protein [Planctomycetota bacterium]
MKTMSLKMVLSLVLASLGVILVVQNVEVVEVNLLFWHVSMSRALVIFFSLLSGFVIGWLLNSYLAYRRTESVAGR